MGRRLVALASAVAIAALPGHAQAASDHGATKVGLQVQAFGDCTTGPIGGERTGGFAIIHANGAGKAVAVLSLKRLTPHHTYDVALVQTPSGTDCFTPDATVRTNNRGNGTVNIHEKLRRGTTGVFLLVQPSDDNGFIHSTPLVTVR
jgi:hypothetical protein